jgi:hypothetical protein
VPLLANEAGYAEAGSDIRDDEKDNGAGSESEEPARLIRCEALKIGCANDLHRGDRSDDPDDREQQGRSLPSA